jgi:hypothetical protein
VAPASSALVVLSILLLPSALSQVVSVGFQVAFQLEHKLEVDFQLEHKLAFQLEGKLEELALQAI